ncbi:MAG TPA: 2Fe-2S iron-sulfur cluster-binding protein [Steroidobacteraceae bacterium]|jgi:ring-1,2-phenylacetyl-CoA epoxidase subunit PaaE
MTHGGLIVAFASGAGIPPVLSLVTTWLGESPANRAILFCGNRSTAEAVGVEEALALKDRCLDRFAVHFVMSREPQDVELYNGRLDAQRVSEFARVLFSPDAVDDYFICGPGDMNDAVSQALASLDVPPERINVLARTPGGPGATPVTYAPAAAPGTAPVTCAPPAATPSRVASSETEVTVIMDGRRRSFTMRTHDDTILEAAERAGIALPFSCRGGVCATCRTKLVQGEVTMDENYALEEWELEAGYILACQSHAKTPVLELNYDEK